MSVSTNQLQQRGGVPPSQSQGYDRAGSEPQHFDELRMQLRHAGLVLLFCTESGVVEEYPRGVANHHVPAQRKHSDDWLTHMLLCSQLVNRMMKDAAQVWAECEEPSAIEPISGAGLWFSPVPLLTRPRKRGLRNGYAVIVLLTDALLDSEHLAALCQSAAMDFEVTRRLLSQSALVKHNSAEVARLLGLGRALYTEHLALGQQQSALDSTGRQLAESYEEISLLYTIIGSMSQVSQPERFIRMACEELLDTLPYQWIGTQLAEDRDRLKAMSGQFFCAGEMPAGTSSSELRLHVTQLLEAVSHGSPLVLEPGRLPSHAQYAPLGNSILVHPVVSDGRVIGAVLAGEKRGDDLAASNVDIKLIGAIASHMSIFLENAALYEDLNATFLGTLEALTASIDAKDRYTCGHSQRVAQLAAQLAGAIGLEEHLVKRVHIAGLVHDVGKIGVPEQLLLKPGKLTPEEFDWIKRHPEIGFRILKDIPQLHDILPGVLHHHEHWNGRGYPSGLRGEEIPQIARLIGLADAFDAMSSTRTYRSAMSREQVLREITRCAGTQFDPELAPVFVRMDFSEYDRLVIDHHAAGSNSVAA